MRIKKECQEDFKIVDAKVVQKLDPVEIVRSRSLNHVSIQKSGRKQDVNLHQKAIVQNAKINK